MLILINLYLSLSVYFHSDRVTFRKLIRLLMIKSKLCNKSLIKCQIMILRTFRLYFMEIIF